MINEVINETEESAKTDAAVGTDTKTENSNAATASETSVSLAETPQTTADETPDSPTTETSSVEEKSSSNEMDFGAILEEFEQDQTTYHTGQLVEGKVVGVSERGILVDFGHKSEGVIAAEEFTSPEGDLTVTKGDDVEVVIRRMHSGDSPPILSRIDAVNRKSWDKIEKSFIAEEPITGTVVEKTKGGLKVDIDGVEAFLPGSQVGVSHWISAQPKSRAKIGRGKIRLESHSAPTLAPSATLSLFAKANALLAFVGAAPLVAQAVAPKRAIKRHRALRLPVIHFGGLAICAKIVISAYRRATGEAGRQNSRQHPGGETSQAKFTSRANWRRVARLKRRFLRPYSRRAARR